MLKTYTKIILGIITFLGTLFGPFSVVVQPLAQQADSHIPTVGFESNVTYAVEDTSTTAAKTVTPTDSDLAVTLESFLKVVYVLLWPALFIAGLAMDNSLVYGEIFGLDNALFKFWQIMKNFANFALGFIFIWSILKYIFDLKGGKAADSPINIIKQLLIGAIGVNASWFIIGALVDLSTALTVGIGGLPLQLIGDDAMANKPIFGSVTSIKLNNAIGQRDNSPILHTRPGSQFTKDGKYFLPCYIEESRIIWDENKRQTAFGISNGQGSITGTNVGRTSIVKNYCVARGNGINKEAYIKANSPLVSDSVAMKVVYEDSFAAITKSDAGNCDTNATCQTLKSFTKKTEGYQGAFYSLYASLLNLSTIHIGVPKSNVSLGMEMLIKMIVALAYLIPLAILAVVLIMRIGYLWLIIAFSPFIVLSSIKGLSGVVKKMDGAGMSIGNIKTKFNFNTVINLLLLPVIVTFTISLSIVFLSSLSEGLTKNGSAESMGIYQRTEGTYKCYDVAITSICLDMPGTDIGTGVFDYFSWMIMNLFGIGLMWFAVMAALKSSEFTAGVAGTIETIGKDMLMSANFIPIPGGGGRTSLGAVMDAPEKLSQSLKTSRSEGSAAFEQTVQGMANDMKNKDKEVNETITSTTTAMQGASTFAAKQAAIVTAINDGKLNAAEHMSFGQADKSLEFANSLSEQLGLKHRFESGKELFTTSEGQQILGKWLKGTGVSSDQLKRIYGDGVGAADWKRYEKGIQNNIGEIPVIENKEEIVLKDKKTDKKLYKKGDKLIVGDEETGDNVLEQKEFDVVIADINTLLKDEKYKDIKIGGEFTVNAKKYRLKKGTDNKVTQELIVNPPTENKTPPPKEVSKTIPPENKTTDNSTKDNQNNGNPPTSKT